jgi:hypothetical protein
MKSLMDDIVGKILEEEKKKFEKFIEDALIESAKYSQRYLIIHKRRKYENNMHDKAAAATIALTTIEYTYTLTDIEYGGNSEDIIAIDTWSIDTKFWIDYILKARNMDKKESEAK